MGESPMNLMPSRRKFLKNSYLGLGGLALVDLLASDLGASVGSAENPLLPKRAHLPAKAKHCIFLFMEGGVSQMDTFEYRPLLDKYAGQQMPSVRGTDEDVESLGMAHNQVIPSPFSFARYGQSGRWMSELFPHLSTCVDEMAFLHGVTVDSSNHGRAVYHTLTGQIFPGGGGYRGLDDLRTGNRESEFAGLYRPGTGGSRGRGCVDLGSRFPACSSSGDALPLGFQSHRQSESQSWYQPARPARRARPVEMAQSQARPTALLYQ